MNSNDNSVVFSIENDFVFKYKKISFFRKLFSIFFRSTQSEWHLHIKMNEGFHISRGFVAILGESGAGKSTLVSILSGFEKLCRVNGKKIKYFNNNTVADYSSTKIKKLKKDEFGFIFQRCYESKSLNATDNISMPLYNKLYADKSIKQYCFRLLESLNLSHISKSPANELSGGQLTRIGILRGIAQTPRVIFADEPANNLDEQNAGLILNILKNWKEQTDGTVIMVTHHLEHAFRFADQIIVLQSSSKNSGEIVYQKEKNDEKWSTEEKQKIRDLLKVKEAPKTQFPKSPVIKNKSFLGSLLFFIKMAWANISSKADGSRTISLITLYSFFLLFYIVFSGNLFVQWFSQMDSKKNNAQYLRQFEVSAAHPPGLSKHVQNKIKNTTVGDVRLWLSKQITNIIIQLDKISTQLKLIKLQHNLKMGINSELNFSILIKHQSVNQLFNIFKDYSYYLSAIIKNNSIQTANIKNLKSAEKIVHKLIRYTEFYIDLNTLDNSSKICNVYPRWETGPEFVKKNGERRNLTTTMRWLDFQDPFFDDPRITYVKNKDFRFKSNNDEGIIIDVETLVHDLGYDINDNEIKVLYGNMEKACVPVKAVVERMPETGKYHVLTTFGFGEKIRSSNQHCDDVKQFYQLHVTFDFDITDTHIQNVFQSKRNKDEYNNIQVNYTQLSPNLLELYCDYDIARTKQLWKKWIIEQFEISSDSFSIIFENDWEVPGKKEKDPPYTDGTVYTKSADAVRALGEYLSQAFQENENYYDRCLINAYDYAEKIQFAKQSESIVSWIKLIGSLCFSILFLIFLGTNMLVTIRNKAPEIAIFQAMGGTLLSLLLIYNIQMTIILILAALSAIIFVFMLIRFIQSLFISYIIQSIWSKIEDQRDAIVDITSNSHLENFYFIFNTNFEIIAYSILFMLIVVSISIVYVRISPNYSVTKILKER